MAFFTIDTGSGAVEYGVALRGDIETEDLAMQGERWDGSQSSTVTNAAERCFAHRWPLAHPEMTHAAALALKAGLDAAGTVDLAGDFIAATVSTPVTVYAIETAVVYYGASIDRFAAVHWTAVEA